jgi:hypothetical protein
VFCTPTEGIAELQRLRISSVYAPFDPKVRREFNLLIEPVQPKLPDWNSVQFHVKEVFKIGDEVCITANRRVSQREMK